MLFILLVMKFIIKEVTTLSGNVQLKLLEKMVLLFLFVMVGNFTVEQTTERISDQDGSKLNNIAQKEKISKRNTAEDDDEEDEEADLGGSDEFVSGGDDDSDQLPDQQNTDQQELELQDDILSEMGSETKLKRGQIIQ